MFLIFKTIREQKQEIERLNNQLKQKIQLSDRLLAENQAIQKRIEKILDYNEEYVAAYKRLEKEVEQKRELLSKICEFNRIVEGYDQ